MSCAVFSLLSLLTVAAPPAPAPAEACVPAPGPGGAITCDLTEPPGTQTDPAAPDTDETRFATPAVIDCRVPMVPGPLQALVGECDGTPRDASYRTSRDPDSE